MANLVIRAGGRRRLKLRIAHQEAVKRIRRALEEVNYSDDPYDTGGAFCTATPELIELTVYGSSPEAVMAEAGRIIGVVRGRRAAP